MREFVELILSHFEVFGFAVPLLWVLVAGLLAAAAAFRAWSPLGVGALLAGFSYLVPLIKP